MYFYRGRGEGGGGRFEEGVGGIFGVGDIANVRFGFSVFVLKNCDILVFILKTAVFRFWRLARFAGFLQFSL